MYLLINRHYMCIGIFSTKKEDENGSGSYYKC